jgi:hypothetical protein
LLESICDVGTARECASAPCTGQQLERGLAVAVFEILTREAMAVGCQQQLASRTGDERDRLGGIESSETAPL